MNARFPNEILVLPRFERLPKVNLRRKTYTRHVSQVPTQHSLSSRIESRGGTIESSSPPVLCQWVAVPLVARFATSSSFNDFPFGLKNS